MQVGATRFTLENSRSVQKKRNPFVYDVKRSGQTAINSKKDFEQLHKETIPFFLKSHTNKYYSTSNRIYLPVVKF